MHSFISITTRLPEKTQEVEIMVNGTISQCMFYYEKSNIYPGGFFGTYYKMVIDNVTHWRHYE